MNGPADYKGGWETPKYQTIQTADRAVSDMVLNEAQQKALDTIYLSQAENGNHSLYQAYTDLLRAYAGKKKNEESQIEKDPAKIEKDIAINLRNLKRIAQQTIEISPLIKFIEREIEKRRPIPALNHKPVETPLKKRTLLDKLFGGDGSGTPSIAVKKMPAEGRKHVDHDPKGKPYPDGIWSDESSTIQLKDPKPFTIPTEDITEARNLITDAGAYIFTKNWRAAIDKLKEAAITANEEEGRTIARMMRDIDLQMSAKTLTPPNIPRPTTLTIPQIIQNVTSDIDISLHKRKYNAARVRLGQIKLTASEKDGALGKFIADTNRRIDEEERRMLDMQSREIQSPIQQPNTGASPFVYEEKQSDTERVPRQRAGRFDFLRRSGAVASKALSKASNTTSTFMSGASRTANKIIRDEAEAYSNLGRNISKGLTNVKNIGLERLKSLFSSSPKSRTELQEAVDVQARAADRRLANLGINLESIKRNSVKALDEYNKLPHSLKLIASVGASLATGGSSATISGAIQFSASTRKSYLSRYEKYKREHNLSDKNVPESAKFMLGVEAGVIGVFWASLLFGVSYGASYASTHSLDDILGHGTTNAANSVADPKPTAADLKVKLEEVEADGAKLRAAQEAAENELAKARIEATRLAEEAAKSAEIAKLAQANAVATQALADSVASRVLETVDWSEYALKPGETLEKVLGDALTGTGNIDPDMLPRQKLNVIYNILHTDAALQWRLEHGINNINEIKAGTKIDIQSLINKVKDMNINGRGVIARAQQL